MFSMSLPARLPVTLINYNLLNREARRLVQIVSIREHFLYSGSSGPGSSPDRGHCVVFLGTEDTLLSQCLSPPRCLMLGVILRWTSIPSSRE